MYILLIVIIAALLLCLLGLIGLLNMKNSNDHEKDTSFLDFVSHANENYRRTTDKFIEFTQQSRSDMHALQIGHNEIVENYEMEFLSLREANTASQQEIAALRGSVEFYREKSKRTEHQRDILRLAVEDHKEECLPAVGKPEYYEDLEDVLRQLEDEDEKEASAEV